MSQVSARSVRNTEFTPLIDPEEGDERDGTQNFDWSKLVLMCEMMLAAESSLSKAKNEMLFKIFTCYRLI